LLAKTDQRVLNALVALRASHDFDVVREWIELSLSDLDDEARHTKDETLLRWYQGAAQALESLVDRINAAPDVIRKSR